MSAAIITLTNQKGGVGKTSTSSALISGLTAHKKRVLGIDLDPQGNLGYSLGIEIEESRTIYDVMKGKAYLADVIQHTKYGDIVPSNILLSTAELEFNRPGREYMLKNALTPIENLYDYIIIDTPPALNILTVNAYVVSQGLIIPMIPDILSLLGVSQINETIDTVKKFYNPNLQVLGILLTKYNGRMNLTKEVEEMANEIAAQFDSTVFKAKIRNSVSVAEAPAHGESIYDYSGRSKPAQDYWQFVEEVLDKKL